MSQPNDLHEHEADRVADEVMRMAAPGERKAAACAGCAGGGSTCSRCGAENARVLRRVGDPGGDRLDGFAPDNWLEALGPGRPLDAAARAFFEPRFGHDFSHVRVHTDDRAAESARAVNALAYTAGHDIVFGRAQYASDASTGGRLLAHELVHVLQQRPAANRAGELAERAGPAADVAPAVSAGAPPLIRRACHAAGIGAPAGCTDGAPVFLSGYPAFRFVSDCDDLAPGQQALLIGHAMGLPADAAFEVHGFSSVGGDPGFNENLSCARALKAKSVLTDPVAAGGAGVAAARIAGVFSHGATPGPSGARATVVLAPPTPTPLPAAVPAPGATEFRITRVGTSTTSRIFFARATAVLNAGASAQISAIKASAPASVRLIGFASADETATVAQDRADAVRAALTAAPNSVTVTSAVGNAAATETRSDFTQARSVEVLVGAAAPATLDCAAVDLLGNPVNPPKQACTTMDPPTWTAFNAALPIAQDAMTRAVTAVAGVPDATDAPVIDRFFGNHSAATLTTLRANLANLETNVNNLPARTECGGQCDIGGCDEGPIAYHTQASVVPPKMTLCVPTFKNLHVNDQTRNLVHETAHGTSPLGGAPGTGTRDVAYRHERMLFHLAPADRLRNSDSYALFALFLREVQTTGVSSAVPAGISTPASDTITGFVAPGERPALELALARLEKRLTWAKDWVGQLYGQVNSVRTGALTWAASWAEALMSQAALRFPLTAPPAAPTIDDQTRVAAILDRYQRMRSAVKRDLTVTRMATGVVSWPVAMTFVAGDTLEVGPDFFRATPDHQVSLLLENLAHATRDVESAFVPGYVSLAEWIHAQNP
ncbi:MAG: eCIS core domain-containing protein [Candidatus Rokuibacteriota bacterium]